MDGTPSSSEGNEPDRLLQSLKRQTIPTACHNCRSKKVKCDGRLPCGYCSRRSLACSYESTLASETPQQAKKRKYIELTQRSEEFQELYNMLAGQDESRAIELFRRIRNGDNLETLFTQVQHGTLQQDGLSAPGQSLRRMFIFSLIESTATLQDVAHTSTAFMANNRITLPPQEAYEPLRDRVVTLDRLSGILTEANPQASTETPRSRSSSPEIDVLPGPLYWVPAQPWLTNTSDEEASHMLSLFFCFVNHSWRFVEIQPFLEAMRSKNLQSQYCSPFLVNAMMALATLHSEPGEAGLGPEHYTAKGMKYHNEALRLWSLAEAKPSVTNIQALMVLAIECIVRGKDEQGFGLLASGTSLNGLLPTVDSEPHMTKAEKVYARVRGCVWWMAVHVDLTYKVGLMLGGDGTEWSAAPALEDYMPDTVQYWMGYPLRSEPIAIHANLLFHYQCSFTRLLWEATRILIWDASELDARREHARVVRQLSAQMKDWHRALPESLHFAARMPPSLYDLHTQYHCIQMALHERTYMQMYGPMHNRVGDVDQLSDRENEELRAYLRGKALQHCYEGATSIRTYRETYGLKCISFILLNHSIMGVFICLNDMHANPQAHQSHPTNHTGSVQDTIAALEEFFRVLLATSLRWTLSRGLARTAYHTATEELHIKLPDSIVQMIHIMSATSWQGADMNQLSSTNYPNWSMPYVHNTNRVEDYRMGDLLKKWESMGVRQPGALEFRPSSSSGTAAYDPVRDQ
ncbi:putative zn(2)-C6 fungal-type DNA-binding domain-containing protein [Septoria linicola]|nr:putative zn(2)-C6 fungal-type DNA-binding domain-containing protein [Septoria linicola]